MPKPFSVVSLLIIFLTAIASNSQTPEPNAISKPDYSKEASIVEQYTLKVRFENDGTSIQDTASEITRQAPFYSDLREKHVPVKGLGLGDILEYKTVATPCQPLWQSPLLYWNFNYLRTEDSCIRHS